MEPTSRSNHLPQLPLSPLAVDFDDLTTGVEFVTQARTVTEADIVAFAGLTGDRHPLHTDEVYARSSLMGERTAHGLLVLSYALGLVPIDPERVLALRRAEATFKAPVRIGDTIRVKCIVGEAKPVDDRMGLVRFRWRVVNQREKTVVRADVDVLWRRAVAGAGSGTDVELVCPPL